MKMYLIEILWFGHWIYLQCLIATGKLAIPPALFPGSTYFLSVLCMRKDRPCAHIKYGHCQPWIYKSNYLVLKGTEFWFFRKKVALKTMRTVLS